MSSIKEFSDSLAEEILTEAANTFIGERKQIESQIETFFFFIKELSERARYIDNKISLLNYLLLNDEIVKDFYQCIEVEDVKFLKTKAKLHVDVILEKMPRYFSLRKRYAALVLKTYESLQIDINLYLSGDDESRIHGEQNAAPEVNYNMILVMGNLINDNINKINDKKSISSILQFTKSLNPELMEKEKVAGAMSPEYGSRLNDKFRIEAIDMDNLPIEKYPELPEPDNVKKKIIKLCNEIYKQHKNKIAELISNLSRLKKQA